MKRRLCQLAACASAFALSTIAFADGVTDDFCKAEREGRSALRGAWTFENNIARCVSDPELYKKFANHGPILRWPVTMMDGTVKCEFQPKKCQRIVLTLNETGHVFRVILMDGSNPKVSSRIFGWAGPSKTTKQGVLADEGLPVIADVEGEWVSFKMVITGNQAKVTIGDHTVALEHASIARPKGEFTISFASGELAVRNVEIVPSEK